MGEVGEEDGDENIGHHPGEGQQYDAETVDEVPPTALGLGQTQVASDAIGVVGCQSDDGAFGAAVAIQTRHGVRIADAREGREAIRQRGGSISRRRAFRALLRLRSDFLLIRRTVAVAILDG